MSVPVDGVRWRPVVRLQRWLAEAVANGAPLKTANGWRADVYHVASPVDTVYVTGVFHHPFNGVTGASWLGDGRHHLSCFALGADLAPPEGADRSMVSFDLRTQRVVVDGQKGGGG